ncbi:flagellar basal-body MS-ring/collar protein FliF [Nocardioides sp.]|uniref:flagellar basal-body MS-ring/collar protein FliF n=1 Tax=Nocardioides sp. TaxID=35761 RepID=UPI002638DE07|nr:flagellar basal-body MS-ring/collar protein FliF [Nocardioides sp.]
MRENLTRQFSRYGRTFADFTVGQKAVALIGTAALLLGGFLVFRWASAPTYSPLYSNLAASDASAVADELTKEGVKYELTNGGATILVPKTQVDSARIAMAGKGLPASSSQGYPILDNQSLSTSDFQEQTNFKRAMEGELTKTIEAIDGIDTAVVHLAIPEKQVFSDSQDPTTASVLVKTGVGQSVSADKVKTIVNLVASSIGGLDPSKVTVADATGKVLTTETDSAAGAASTQAAEVSDFQNEMQTRLQSTLDQVVGVGNSTATVTANLNFDKTTTKKRVYTYDKNVPPLSETTSIEKYNGTGSGSNAGVGGVVGPDGQMDPVQISGSPSGYASETTTKDNAVGQVDTVTEAAPGSVGSLHIAVMLDSAKVGTIQPADIRNYVAAATGINTARGDTVDVTSMPFDRTAENANAAELAKAEAAKAAAQRWTWIRNGGLVAIVALIILLAYLKSRRKAKARELATSYVVEQLRSEADARATAQANELEAGRLLAELEHSGPAEPNPADEIREQLNSLVERQPEDVAALLRGWLVDHKS